MLPTCSTIEINSELLEHHLDRDSSPDNPTVDDASIKRLGVTIFRPASKEVLKETGEAHLRIQQQHLRTLEHRIAEYIPEKRLRPDKIAIIDLMKTIGEDMVEFSETGYANHEPWEAVPFLYEYVLADGYYLSFLFVNPDVYSDTTRPPKIATLEDCMIKQTNHTSYMGWLDSQD